MKENRSSFQTRSAECFYFNLGAQGCEWGSPHSCILTVTVEGDSRKNLGGKCPFSVVLVLYVNRRSSCAGFWFLIIINCVFFYFFRTTLQS